MTPRQLEAIGRALYGTRWINPMARAIGVHDQTVRRWSKGVFEVHEDFVSSITALVHTKIATLQKVARGLG